MFKQILYIAGILLLTIKPCFVQAQSKGIAEIDKATTEKKYEQAEAILQPLINNYFSERKADSLVNYIFYMGKLEHVKNNPEQAVKKLGLFIDKIKTLSPPPVTLRQAYIEAGEYYGFAGLNKLAYKANQEAYKYTLLIPGKQPAQLGMIENNMSTYAQRMGDLNLSQMHGRSALQHLLADPKKNYEALHIAYNGMGAATWYAAKTDSALYYFTLSLKALEKAARTPVNQYYRPAVIQNNVSAIYGQKGNTTEAINAMKACINNLNSFLATKEPNMKKGTAITFQFEATDNLAGIYKELGDMKQAHELLEYSYRQKQKNLSPNDPGIFISQILLGQIYYAMREYDKSLQYLNSGLTMISKADGDHLFWQADACNTLALLYDEKHNNRQATLYYEKADSLYEESLQGEYDDIYLDFLRNASLYYAENGQPEKALSKANKAYNYIVKNQGPETLMAFYQLMNLSEVSLLSGKPRESLAYSNKGLNVVNKRIRSGNNLLDSIKMELKKPKAILLKAKAEYQLLQKKDAANLTILLNELNEALSVLERRKSVVNDAENITLIMADHNELLDFVKKITLDLYKLTNNQAYVDRIISLQESGLYNRIRSRLDKNDSLQFANVPAATRLQERQLKAALNASLEGSGSHDEKMQRYFKATDQWNKYQDELKTNYPRYYKMRYASIFKSPGEIQQSIPINTTLIRYFFVGKDLFALVADSKQKKIFPLEMKGVEDEVTALSQNGMSAEQTAGILHDLYVRLWLPLSKSIAYKKIIIIPDGVLYNLNFDILTPQKIHSFRELSTKSLLANYTISYRYSLFLLDQKSNAPVLTNNFIAFAPGFTDKIKASYRAASRDPLEVDRNYLSLLPQPFTLALASRVQKLFGGDAYLNDQSTERCFKINAGNHQIIHIGTHAESNNDHPEFSRLIFAKDNSAKEDNSLFVDEIYNCDLVSHLTVLTACESGKPGYQDGEGMISLAHAFNYAGSESILTGLWKIDEQASALLMELFYKNLINGLPKDEALRQAKLTYLQQAEGRMLAPQYWAGLVIMGDTSPVILKQKTSWWLWVTGAIIILLIAAGIFYKIKKSRA